MNTIKVNASKCYEVKIGQGLLANIGGEVRSITKAKVAAIVSDTNVWPLYGKLVQESLENAGISSISFVFEAGESSKNAETYVKLLNFLAQNKLTRSDCLIALGGGVVGDLTGFAAATYLRGIPCIQVPTTLLAMVDSSVGGKTAIDLDSGKNLVGAFYQPSLVLCDTDTLVSLPEDIFRDGCAEVIKYGVLYDPELFAHLQEHGLDFQREWVISRCVELKRNVVAEDEFDTGSRMKLNLGHTIGHGIELCSNFTVSHGQAVSIGMAMVCRMAARGGLCDVNDAAAIEALLVYFGLPVTTCESPQQLYLAALSDKKRAGDSVHLIVPKRIGECVIQTTPVEEMNALIEAGY